MTKLVAVSGTHGCGKSTLLSELSRVPGFVVDDFKVSRSVQNEFEMGSLSEIDTPEKVIKFQNRVLIAKFENDKRLKDKYSDSRVVFVERSFFDIVVYTLMWIDQYSDKLLKAWYRNYVLKILSHQKIYDGGIVVHSHVDIPFEIDPNRASLDTRDKFEKTLGDVIYEWGDRHRQPHHHVYVPGLEERVSEVSLFIDYLHQRPSVI